MSDEPKVGKQDLHHVYDTTELAIIERQTTAGHHNPRKIYLLHKGGSPVRLGSGRYAVVVAAVGGGDVHKAREYLAVKFLKTDRDSATISRNSRTRYFEELSKTVVFGSADGGFVEYVGYARLKELPNYAYDSKNNRERVEEEFEQDFAAELEAVVAKNCAAAKALAPEFLEDIQGDFFVMQAEEGTLEDLLFYDRPWHSRAIFTVRPELRHGLEDMIEANRDNVRRFLAHLRVPEKLAAISARDARLAAKRSTTTPSGSSGLALLNHVGSLAPSVKNRIAISLVEELAKTVSVVHQKTDKPDGSMPAGGWLAHRDLKPGNFLFSCVAKGQPHIRLANLGFVAGTESARSLGATRAAAVREPIVLAPGSYLFRAPEQMLSAIEVRFEVLDRDLGQIGFSDFGRVIDPRVGDMLECQELTFIPRSSIPGSSIAGSSLARRADKAVDLAMSQAAVGLPKVLIAAVERDRERVTLHVNAEIRTRSDAGDGECYVGYVVKSSGQHTDVFALGCLLYLLASGGKNPEKLYLKCLESQQDGEEVEERLETAHGEGSRYYSILHRDCLSLALSLCVELPEDIAEDVEAYIKMLDEEILEIEDESRGAQADNAARSDNAARTANAAQSASPSSRREGMTPTERLEQLRQARSQLLGTIATIRPTVLEALGMRVDRGKKWFASRDASASKADKADLASLRKYLQLQRESPMVQYNFRDANGHALPFPIVYEIIRCMVRDKPDSYVRRRAANTSYFDVDCHKLAFQFGQNLKTILRRCPSAKPALGDYLDGRGDALNLFLHLRICADENHGSSAARSAMPEPSPDRGRRLSAADRAEDAAQGGAAVEGGGA